MSRGPGLTGDKNFEHSCEYFRRGSDRRHIAYGQTQEDILALLSAKYGDLDKNWEDKWVVMPTRSIRLGLGPQWARVTRRYDREYHMI